MTTGQQITDWIRNQFAPDPYEVPASQQLDVDSLDPDSVADRNGADLDRINPDVGDVIDLAALDPQ